MNLLSYIEYNQQLDTTFISKREPQPLRLWSHCLLACYGCFLQGPSELCCFPLLGEPHVQNERHWRSDRRDANSSPHGFHVTSMLPVFWQTMNVSFFNGTKLILSSPHNLHSILATLANPSSGCHCSSGNPVGILLWQRHLPGLAGWHHQHHKAHVPGTPALVVWVEQGWTHQDFHTRTW